MSASSTFFDSSLSRAATAATLNTIAQAHASASQSAQPSQTDSDAGQLSEGIVEDLSYMLLELNQRFAQAEVRSESKALANGRSIDEIVQYAAEHKALPVWNADTRLSRETQDKLIARANAGIKTYKKHGIEFASLLNKYGASKMGDITHEQARELLRAGGVDHPTSAELGSAFDALIAAIPKALVKLPVNAALDSDMQGLAADAVNISGVSAATEKSAGRLAAAPLKSASRAAVTTTMKSLTDIGWWGRSIPPGAEDMVVKPQNIERLQEQIAQLALNPSMTAVGTSAEQSQDELRKLLTEQLQTMQAEQAEFLDAMGVSTEQRRALVTAFGDVGVKIAARVGGGIALSAAGVPALTPLIAAVVYRIQGMAL